ncbi:MAG: transcriptional repressor [Myxococcales bacterium FL481]|nr:MAG: transcriptional repressor [Myxococcales bacterium FL481]
MPRLSRDDARTRLRDAGLRATAPRVAVLRLLAATDHPLSHAEVVDAVGSDEWDQATLYRNLIRLREAGLVRVASQVGGITRYEAQLDPSDTHLHPHFACRTCGIVECLPHARLIPPPGGGWKEVLADADLQIVGYCLACRRQGIAQSHAAKTAGRSSKR